MTLNYFLYNNTFPYYGIGAYLIENIAKDDNLHSFVGFFRTEVPALLEGIVTIVVCNSLSPDNDGNLHA